MDTVEQLQALIADALARLNAAPKGSAERKMIVRQLIGLRDRLYLLTEQPADTA